MFSECGVKAAVPNDLMGELQILLSSILDLLEKQNEMVEQVLYELKYLQQNGLAVSICDYQGEERW